MWLLHVYDKMIHLYIYLYLFIFKFFSHLGYDTIFSSIPCAIYSRSLLIIYFKYSSVCMLTPNSQSIPPLPYSFLVTLSSLSKSVSLFLFCK